MDKNPSTIKLESTYVTHSVETCSDHRLWWAARLCC